MTLVRMGRMWNELLKVEGPKVRPLRLLSILIPSIPERFPLLMRLMWQLQPQVSAHQEAAEILLLADNRAIPIGTKLDALADIAEGCFATVVADDDLVAPTYVDEILSAIKQHPDSDAITFDFNLHKRGGGLLRLTECLDAPSAGWEPREPGWLHTWPSDKAAIRLGLRRQLRHKPLFDNEDEQFTTALRPLLKNVAHIPHTLYDIWQDPATAKERQCL